MKERVEESLVPKELQEYINAGAVLRKGDMVINILPRNMVPISAQRKYITVVFRGGLPARGKWYGKRYVELPAETVFGFAEWSKAEKRFIQDSIRIIRINHRIPTEVLEQLSDLFKSFALEIDKEIRRRGW